MSSQEPLWFCHQCQAEMRPLMTPHPVCASCRSSFVEKLENPADDPRDFQNRAPDAFDPPDNFPGAFENFLRSRSWTNTEDSTTHRPRSPPTAQTQDAPSSASSGFRFEFHSGGPGGGSTRTFILRGPNSLRRSPPPADRSVPTMFELLRRDMDGTHNLNATGSDINGPLMAQYLLALIGREPFGNASGQGLGDPFAELFSMPSSARWGDYVFNQEALDQILTQLAENSTAGRPVPATEEIIANLPREVLTEGSPLLERDCAVCKESFKLNTEDPDELVVITLPCKHPFHEGCILPWLKSSGTCPVCRFALISQPQQHPPGGPSGGGSGPSRSNTSSGSRQQASDRGGPSGLLHTLFGGGTSTSNGDTHSARSRHNLGRGNRNAPSEVTTHNTPPVPGRWIEDID